MKGVAANWPEVGSRSSIAIYYSASPGPDRRLRRKRAMIEELLMPAQSMLVLPRAGARAPENRMDTIGLKSGDFR